MAKLVIRRANELANRTKRVQLILDGKDAGNIKCNSTEEYEVAPGLHTISAKQSRLGSNEFTFNIADGETKYVKLRGMPYSNALMIIMFALLGVHLLITWRTKEMWGAYLLIPPVLYQLYFTTIARKKYFTIEETDFF